MHYFEFDWISPMSRAGSGEPKSDSMAAIATCVAPFLMDHSLQLSNNQ
jgi:hypothetical protein